MGVVWSSGGCIVEEILALSVADRKRVAGGGIIRCGVPHAIYRLAALSYEAVGQSLGFRGSGLFMLAVGWTLELSVALSLDLCRGGALAGLVKVAELSCWPDMAAHSG